MKNATIEGGPGVFFRLALCALLVWGLAPLSAYADEPSSEAPTTREEVIAPGDSEALESDTGVESAADEASGGGDGASDGIAAGADGAGALDANAAGEAELFDPPDAEPAAEADEAIDFAEVSDFASLQSAVNAAAPGATIEVAGTIVFTDEIALDKALTIKGDGSAVLTAAPGKRHFRVDGTTITGVAAITFENAVFEGPASTIDDEPNGGIVVSTTSMDNLVDARIVVKDCSFYNNANMKTGSGISYGGALGVTSKTRGVEISNSDFDGNYAFGDGGALGLKSSSATLTECTFTNNRSDTGGGALSGAAGTTIVDCLFEGNVAEGNGGAATFTPNNTSAITVQGSTFSDNSAKNSGGGLHVLNFNFSGIPTCTIENSTFVGNEVTNPISSNRTYLGGAALLDAQTTLRSVTAVGNSGPDGSNGTGAGIVLFEQGFDGMYANVVEGCLAVGNYQDGVEKNLGIMNGMPFGSLAYEPFASAAASVTEIPAGLSLGDIVSVDDAGAALLQNNGGITPTVALNPDGIAVDAYEAADVTLAPLGVDQRGKTRPAGDAGRNDAGAFELQDNERSRGLSIARLYGADRYETSRAVSTHDRAGSDVVILASGDDGRFPDALAASALSGAENNAPIVLTPTSWLSTEARMAIEVDLQPSRVIIIGDPNAVSMAVEDEVRSILGPAGTIERIGGTTRQDTADKIYETYADEFSTTAILALATDFPDALSISSWAAKTKSPIFLAHFGSTGLSDKTLRALSDGGFERILVMGSSLSVSDEVVLQALEAANLGYGDYKRFAGIDRYETSALFAAWATSADRDPSERLSMHGGAVVRGDKHADSLTGGALQGRDSSVVLLTRRDAATPTVENLLDAHVGEIGELRFFGDEYAVELDVVRHYIQRIPYTAITWLPDDSVAIL